MSLINVLNKKYTDDFFFIQVGANDGRNDDPIYKFVTQHKNIKGILIEPLPHCFKKLKENYKDYDNLIFENVAVHKHLKEATLYTMPLSLYTSFNKNHIPKRFDKTKIKEVVVPCMSAKEIIDKYSIKHVDFLQIDTEGYDWEIVTDFIENANILPDVLNFEIIHLDKSINYTKYLFKKGYNNLIKHRRDALFYKQIKKNQA